MKRVFLAVVIILLLAVTSWAQETQTEDQVLIFEWEQSAEDLGGISGWVLYSSDTTGSGYAKVLDIPYVPGAGPLFTSEGTIMFSGAKGSTVSKYFVLTAKSKDLTIVESDYSNEATISIVIPYGKPSSPFNLIIKVTVGQ